MLISEKQHEANIRNSQHSTGPKTLEGRTTASMNALTFGLRASCLILETENVEDYLKLWDGFEIQWQPANRTEYCLLETMVSAQWLLIRADWSENLVHQQVNSLPEQLALLDRVDKRRLQMERSFRTAMDDLKKAQAERRAAPVQAQAAKAEKPASPSVPPPQPLYVMSAGEQGQAAYCAPVNDSR